MINEHPSFRAKFVIVRPGKSPTQRAGRPRSRLFAQKSQRSAGVPPAKRAAGSPPAAAFIRARELAAMIAWCARPLNLDSDRETQ
jgi:hypothetical protein